MIEEASQTIDELRAKLVASEAERDRLRELLQRWVSALGRAPLIETAGNSGNEIWQRTMDALAPAAGPEGMEKL